MTTRSDHTDRNMDGAEVFIKALILNQPIWPNSWGQDVAAAAFMLTDCGTRSTAKVIEDSTKEKTAASYHNENEFTVGELVPAIEYLSYKKIGGNLLEEISEKLSGEIDSDIVERSFEWTEKDEEELGKIVLDYIDRHIGFNCFGIKNERVIQGIA